MSTHMNKGYKEDNVENERRKVQAQLPKPKNSPLILKDLTKVKSRSDRHCLELSPCGECTGSVANPWDVSGICACSGGTRPRGKACLWDCPRGSEIVVVLQYIVIF